MRRLLFTLGSALLLIGCAHERGGTGDVYYGTDSGMDVRNNGSADLNSATNGSNRIERSRQGEYPSETQPRFDRF
jgi:hypothetical protein